MKAHVFVRLKPAILDPQGKTVLQAAHQIGFTDIQSVRIGKLIEIVIDAEEEQEARQRLEELSTKLLSNPQMENFEIQWIDDKN